MQIAEIVASLNRIAKLLDDENLHKVKGELNLIEQGVVELIEENEKLTKENLEIADQYDKSYQKGYEAGAADALMN